MSGQYKLQKQILQQGTGDTIPENARAIVDYTGKFLNGQVFDSSVQRGTPFEFNLGRGEVIRGWDACVKTMRQGERCMLLCPPEYAYGERGAPGAIPPNTPLMFEIELLGWN